jgi:hypothetical protein
MDERQRRMAQNEALFREVNERIDELSEDQRRDRLAARDYLCECANSDCTFSVPLTADEYEAIRADSAQFAVLPEHYTPEIEKLVSERDRYWVVKKVGETAEYVSALDPRSR